MGGLLCVFGSGRWVCRGGFGRVSGGRLSVRGEGREGERRRMVVIFRMFGRMMVCWLRDCDFVARGCGRAGGDELSDSMSGDTVWLDS